MRMQEVKLCSNKATLTLLIHWPLTGELLHFGTAKKDSAPSTIPNVNPKQSTSHQIIQRRRLCKQHLYVTVYRIRPVSGLTGLLYIPCYI